VYDFGFFRSRRPGYVPRTPGAALRAVGVGAAPPEQFVYASCSAKPLNEEPFDLEAIERTLAKKDLTLETAILLRNIFEKLIGSGGPETALFGAEGINALEGRLVTRIEELKKSPRRGGGPGILLARAYYELAELHGNARAIRAFYLREAYASLQKTFVKGSPASHETLALLVDILVGLGLYDHAAHVLGRVKPADNPFVLYQRARVAFHKKETVKIVEACRALGANVKDLPEAGRRAVEFWAGK
jgi:hypothetical protein